MEAGELSNIPSKPHSGIVGILVCKRFIVRHQVLSYFIARNTVTTSDTNTH